MIFSKNKLSRTFILLISVMTLFVSCFSGCTGDGGNSSTPTTVQPSAASNEETYTEQTVQQIITETEKIEPQGTLTDDEYIENLISGMTLDEKIFQMLFVTPESITGVGHVIQAGKGTAEALKKYPVGGIIYFARNIQSREQISKMISNSQGFSKIPLFIGIDEEGGSVSRLGNIAKKAQPPMKEIGESGDPKKAYKVGAELASDLNALGFNVDFAPVADVLVNSQNSVIGSRSFGSDPKLVSEMVAQEVKGLQNNNISATLKHFPGHGSTSTDSHTGYSATNRTMDELRSCEFLPFKAGIDAGVDFVMVAHITAANATKDNLPATLSKELITDCLKGELGFEGLVITDSFQMGAITKNFSESEAVVKAIDAGVDIILMPQNVSEAHLALKQAVKSGKLTEDRINESVRKILSTKLKRNILNK